MSTAQTPSTPTKRIPFGAYFGNPNGSDPAAEKAFEAQANSFAALMGAPAALLTYYVDQAKPVSAWADNAGWQAWSAAQSPAAKDAIPVIGLPLTSTASPLSADQQYEAFASGRYDDAVRGVVKAWAANGFKTQYWRPGWEMNVPNMPSYGGTDAGTQADWVAAFQHVSTVLRQEAAADKVDLKVVWNPNATNWDTTSTLKALYPGDAYVDVVGADVYAGMYPYNPLYDWGRNDGTNDATLAQWMADPANRAHYWSHPAATQWSLDGSGGHDLSLQDLLDFAQAHGKPFAVPETGAGDATGGHDVPDEAAFPAWLAQTLAAYQASGGSVAFVNAWDANADGNYDFSSAGANKPGEAAAWAKYFGISQGAAQTTTQTGAQTTGQATAQQPAAAADTLSFGFAFASAKLQFLPGKTLLTAPDGSVTDVTKASKVGFSDGTVQKSTADAVSMVDPLFYYARNMDVWNAHMDAGQHYDQYGWKEGRDPDALFSTKGYLAANPDVARAGVNPAQHYAQYGWKEGRSGAPAFTADATRAAGADLLAQHDAAVRAGSSQSVAPTLDAKGLIGDFDPQFYLGHNQDVAKAAAASGKSATDFALQHYDQYGWKEGRDPDALFSTKWYLAANPDVARAGIDPLLHYEQYGWKEGRDPGPGFSTTGYLNRHQDVAAAKVDPLQHYLEYGQANGWSPTG